MWGSYQLGSFEKVKEQNKNFRMGGDEVDTTPPSTMIDLLPAYHHSNNSHMGNDTIDVMIRGCFGYFDTIACVR